MNLTCPFGYGKTEPGVGSIGFMRTGLITPEKSLEYFWQILFGDPNAIIAYFYFCYFFFLTYLNRYLPIIFAVGNGVF